MGRAIDTDKRLDKLEFNVRNLQRFKNMVMSFIEQKETKDEKKETNNKRSSVNGGSSSSAKSNSKSKTK